MHIAEQIPLPKPFIETLFLKPRDKSKNPLLSQQATVDLTVTTLRRSVLPTAEIQSIQTTLGQWNDRCLALLAQTDDGCHDNESFEDSMGMCSILSASLNEKEFDPTERVLLCTESKSSKIQGVALVCDTDNFLIVKYIVPNPENIQSQFTTTTTEKIRGVGTAIIAECARQGLLNGKKGLFLQSLLKALQFYKNCGFDVIDTSEKYLPNMFLSSKDLHIPGGSTPKLLKVGASLTPQIDRPQSSSTPLFSTSIETREIKKMRTPDFCIKRLPQQTKFYTPRHASSRLFFRKIITSICTTVSYWKDLCNKSLDTSQQKHQTENRPPLTAKQTLLALLATRANEVLRSLKRITKKNESARIFFNKKTHSLCGIATFSAKKNIYTLTSFIVNPALALTSKNISYAHMIDRVGTSLLSSIGAECKKRGKDGVFVTAFDEEHRFFRNRGFEMVGEHNPLGRTGMLAATKSLTAKKKKGSLTIERKLRGSTKEQISTKR